VSLGITTNQQYQIAFCLDSRAMITVHSPTYGVVEVKPLAVIWGKVCTCACSTTLLCSDRATAPHGHLTHTLLVASTLMCMARTTP